GRHGTARYHPRPVCDPRTGTSRDSQCRGGDALYAPIRALLPRRERIPRHRRAHHGVFKRLQDVTPAQIFATAKRILASAPSADGVYIPCNQWSGADAAPLIESELGIPVVTGAHADYWEAFRSLGLTDRLQGHGRLILSLSGEGPAPLTAAPPGWPHLP